MLIGACYPTPCPAHAVRYGPPPSQTLPAAPPAAGACNGEAGQAAPAAAATVADVRGVPGGVHGDRPAGLGPRTTSVDSTGSESGWIPMTLDDGVGTPPGPGPPGTSPAAVAPSASHLPMSQPPRKRRRSPPSTTARASNGCGTTPHTTTAAPGSGTARGQKQRRVDGGAGVRVGIVGVTAGPSAEAEIAPSAPFLHRRSHSSTYTTAPLFLKTGPRASKSVRQLGHSIFGSFPSHAFLSAMRSHACRVMCCATPYPCTACARAFCVLIALRCCDQSRRRPRIRLHRASATEPGQNRPTLCR